jgi:heme-degrading monooxygenase HmoA
MQNRFTALYSFQVASGKEAQFEEAWEGLTRLIYEHEGSYGSRLHKTAQGLYIGYAQWPSREQWRNAGGKLPPEAKALRERMRGACTQIKTLHEMEVVCDLLREDVFGG